MSQASVGKSEKWQKAERAELMKKVVFQNVRIPNLPFKRGRWSEAGKKGNSDWIPDPDAVFRGKDGRMTYAELQEKYPQFDLSRISYVNNEPVFTAFQDEKIGQIKLANFKGTRTGKEGTYRQAAELAAARMGISPNQVQAYMKEHALTWHECGDRETVIAIPTDINSAFVHTGGIGVQRSVNKLAGRFRRATNGQAELERNSPYIGVTETNLISQNQKEREMEHAPAESRVPAAPQTSKEMSKEENSFDPSVDEWAESNKEESAFNPQEDELAEFSQSTESAFDPLEDEWMNAETISSDESQSYIQAEVSFEEEVSAASEISEKHNAAETTPEESYSQDRV